MRRMVTSMCRTPRKPRRHPWPRAAELSAWGGGVRGEGVGGEG